MTYKEYQQRPTRSEVSATVHDRMNKAAKKQIGVKVERQTV